MSSSFTRSHARSCLNSILHPTNPANFELVFASHPQWPLPNPTSKPSISTTSSSSPSLSSSQTSRKLTISCLDSSFNPPTSAHLDMALAGLPPVARRNDKDLGNVNGEAEDGAEEYDALLLLLSARNVDKVLKSGDASFEQRLEMIHLMAQHILKLGSSGFKSNPTCTSPVAPPRAWSNVAIGLLHEPAFVNKDKVVREFLRNRQEPAKPIHDVRLAWLLGTDTVVRFFDQKYYPAPLREALDPFFNSSTPSILVHFPRPVSTEEPIMSSPHVHLSDGSLRQAVIRGGQDRSDVSSSLVRSLIARKTETEREPRDWKDIVPDGVAEFVNTEGLGENTNKQGEEHCTTQQISSKQSPMSIPTPSRILEPGHSQRNQPGSPAGVTRIRQPTSTSSLRKQTSSPSFSSGSSSTSSSSLSSATNRLSQSRPGTPRMTSKTAVGGTPKRHENIPATPDSTPAIAGSGGGMAMTPKNRPSIKDQIRLLRASQATPAAERSGTPRTVAQADRIRSLVKRAAETGKLVIPTTLEKPIDQLPLSLYTLLLGIPVDELSRKVPAVTSSRPLWPSTGAETGTRTIEEMSDRLASLGLEGSKEDVFGTSTKEPAEREVGGFIGGTDLEVLKVTNQELSSLDPELGLFGGLKHLDLRDNKLYKVPFSASNLLQLNTLILSYNAFTQFPSVLTLLPNLQHLDLSHNELTILNLSIPSTVQPLFPGTPPSSLLNSPPPSRDPPSRPCPRLRTLVLNDNKITSEGLPVSWPPCLETLQLGSNPICGSSPKGDNTKLDPRLFEGLDRLRFLGLSDTGLVSIENDGRDVLHELRVLELKGNQSLIRVEEFRTGWGPGREVEFKSTESGDHLRDRGSTSSSNSGSSNKSASWKLEILVDPHMVPKTPGRKKTHIYVGVSPEAPPPVLQVPRTVGRAGTQSVGQKVSVKSPPVLGPRVPSPPRPRTDENLCSESKSGPAEDPFWLPLSSTTAKHTTLPTKTITKKASTKPNVFDDWDESPPMMKPSAPPPAPAPLPPSLPVPGSSSPSGSQQAVSASLSPSTDSLYSQFYSPALNRFTLTLQGRSTDPILPGGSFDFGLLALEPFSPSLQTVILGGKNLRSFLNMTENVIFRSVKILSITSSSVPLSSLVEWIPSMFPGLEELDLSETIVGDALFGNKQVLERLLIGQGLKVLKAREAGVRSLAGLEHVGMMLRNGQTDRWACREVDVRDNSIEKLDPVLGFLSVETFMVDRNLFRSPNRRTWERDGTEGLLRWLRDRA
ncbi:Rossmann-like alpha/beta/alpha sandwich fold [Phaffia rhodozyma]|uniref:Rossmann-like alpha/beta/alpha sandwich fold n=1 Tax=Phaffia rhodozyma TaxID=264483 RepID=A0A0F7SJL6_PHARH|nr:Rossmann-like alpha/beta/alpha sandwich fold [Phaffia rhodozyma]